MLEPTETMAVYDFTYDPSEEPPPQKKKRKRVVRKKTEPKFKTFQIPNHRDMSYAAFNKKAEPVKPKKAKKVQVEPAPITTKVRISARIQSRKMKTNQKEILKPPPVPVVAKPALKNRKATSIGPYSPRPEPEPIEAEPYNSDPLNLLGEVDDIPDDVSFLGDIPVKSMATSTPHASASPWRADFNNLPIRWQSNTYVKPNMTPALESSFISPNDSGNKKHVYTNLVPISNDTLPEIVSNSNTTMNQPSIISFFREAAEKSLRKKMKSLTPLKNNKTPKATTPKKCTTNNNISILSDNFNIENHSTPIKNSTPKLVSNDKENQVRTPLKSKNASIFNVTPVKSPQKCDAENFFGFNDSENRENVSPNKKAAHKGRSLRPRRTALKDLNSVVGPTRVKLPLNTKFGANSEVVNKLYNEMKEAQVPQPPVVEKQIETSTSEQESRHQSVSEDESVHLFEDIEVVHHVKPTRKSYGNAKKVTFNQRTSSDNDDSDKEDDECEPQEAEKSFEIPIIKTRKVIKKKKKVVKMSRKEEEEADAWATAFNSMCKDVDEFPLLLE